MALVPSKRVTQPAASFPWHRDVQQQAAYQRHPRVQIDLDQGSGLPLQSSPPPCSITRLTSYSGANRFFTHDQKYFSRFVDDLKRFVEETLRQPRNE
jgi:hypothetical protein